MSYKLPYFPDRRTGEVIPEAILKDTRLHLTNDMGQKTLNMEISIYRDVEKSRTKETFYRYSLEQLFDLGRYDEKGQQIMVPSESDPEQLVPLSISLSQEDIAEIHAAAVQKAYEKIAEAFQRANVPSFFDGAEEV